MDDAELLARWRAGEPVQAIADAAGVTRQRIAQRVLRAAARSGDDWPAMIGARQAIVDDAARQLAEVERRLAAPADDGQSLDDAIDGVLMLWTRALDVRLTVADDARAALDASPSARGAVADVLAEALTNAFRHGAARAAWVEVSLDGAGVVVQVTDDGVLAEPAGASMGTRLYDESSHEWSLRRGRDDLTHLRVVVPLVTRPAGRRAGARVGPGSGTAAA